MSAAFEQHHRQRVRSATGLLADFNAAGVLEAADVHVAQRLGALAGEADESVLLATALTVRAARQGATCLDLAAVADEPMETEATLPWPEASTWAAAVRSSRLRAAGVLVWDDNMLYLDRYHRDEVQVCRDLVERLRPMPAWDAARLLAGADRILAGESWREQRVAALQAAGQATTVLTGGPGTGKTASVARLLVLLREQFVAEHEREPRIALAAPTGKASVRMTEAVAAEAQRAELAPDRDFLLSSRASTLHSLLGWRHDNSSRFRHDRTHPLPHDVIVVDEVSMVSLPMMARLLEAVPSECRLVLVGDPHQLSSVEAGAVLADLVDGLAGMAESPVARLTITHRTRDQGGEDNRLDALAAALRVGDADAALAVAHDGDPAVRMIDPRTEPTRRDRVLGEIRDIAVEQSRIAASGEADAGARAVASLDRHRLLCAHREGPAGVGHWNRLVQRLVSEQTGVVHYDEWHPGRPVLITANDRGLRVANGDLGMTVRTPDGALRVAIAIDGEVRLFGPTRLPGVETVHAMTVHKSQGSEADRVTVVLPPVDSPLLTRELFYTAVTRARRSVTILGSEEELRAAVDRHVRRASGLRGRLSAALSDRSH